MKGVNLVWGLKHHLEVCKNHIFLQQYAVKFMTLYVDDMILYKQLRTTKCSKMLKLDSIVEGVFTVKPPLLQICKYKSIIIIII